MGHAMAFIAYLSHIGAPVDRFLRSQKLPVSCDDPDMLVPLARAWAFFASAAEHEDTMLGWRVGVHVGDHNLNRGLLRKLEIAPTLYQALHGLARMANSEASHIQLGIHERQGNVLFCTHYSGKRDNTGYSLSQAYQIGVILDLIRHFLGRHWVPDEIGIEHSIAPDVAEALFPGSRILSQQPMGYIAVSRTSLHQTARRGSSTRAAAHDPVMTKDFDYTDTLRAVLRSYLPDGYPTARFAAELMDTSERTLIRKLATRGLTYGTLLDEVRFTEATKLLRKPGMRIEDVALSVGFNNQSNFTRMFRRISGLTPREFREVTLR
jgi:AraC-like DNA-binding protein